MYFCRLLSMVIFALFSTFSWSVSDTLLMFSGYDVHPYSDVTGSAIELSVAQLQTKSSKLQETVAKPRGYSYPISIKVAGVPVEAKQEIPEGDTQVLHFDLRQVQKINDVSELSLSELQQLLFILSRNSKTAVMRFYPLTQTAEIEINHLRIETILPEGQFIRRDLPELLSAKAAYQLLQAVECALYSAPTIDTPVACPTGVIEQLDTNYLFFEASPYYPPFLPEWQIQTNDNESVELKLNSTTQLILTLDSNGVIIKGDVITSEDPSDTTQDKDDKEPDNPKQSGSGNGGNKSSGDRNDRSQKDSTPPNSGANSSSSGGSGDGDGDGDGEKDPKKNTSLPIIEEEEEQDEEQEGEENEEEVSCWAIQDQLLRNIDRSNRGRAKRYCTQKDRSQSQWKKLRKHMEYKPNFAKRRLILKRKFASIHSK